MFTTEKHNQPPAPGEAALTMGLQPASERDAAQGRLAVFVARMGPNRFRWEIRKTGATARARSLILFETADAARTAALGYLTFIGAAPAESIGSV